MIIDSSSFALSISLAYVRSISISCESKVACVAAQVRREKYYVSDDSKDSSSVCD